MNRNTTKVLGLLVTVTAILLAFFLYFGAPIYSTIFKLNEKDISWIGPFIIFPVVVLGFFVISVLTWVVNYRRNSQRQESLQKLAQQNSWTYTQKVELPFLKEFDTDLTTNWVSGPKILTGSSNNVLMGKMNGLNIVVSDQVYIYRGSKSSTTYKDTIVSIELPETFLPFMCLHPEGFLEKVFDVLSKHDIDFVNHPLFSQKYVLYGKNESQIRSFFTPQILSFYEQQPAFTTVCGGKYLIIYDDGLLNPHQIMTNLNLIFTLSNLFLRK